MRRLRAAASALAFAAVCLAACSKLTSGTGGAQSGNAWTHHGVLRIGAYEDIDSLNPLLSFQLSVSDLSQLIYSGLIDYDDHGNPIPDVALQVPSQSNGGISRDGKTITYHLRRNVVFSDGVPLTAADVEFTWQQIVNPKNNLPYRYPYDQAASVQARDPYTLVVHLKSPSAPFVAMFMRNGIVGAIVPKHLLAKYADENRIPFNSRPLGSGPFTIARWEPGSLLDLKANPRYWRGPPKLAEIQYKIIPNQNTLLTAVRSHEIDMYTQATETQFAVLKAIDGFRVTNVPNVGFEHIVFNCRRPPLDDVRVRQAIAYAIDWARLVSDVYLNVDAPGMADESPLNWAFNPQVKPYPHDPQKAKALLAAAGWNPSPSGALEKNGQKLRLSIASVTGITTRQKAEELIQQDLRAVGIELAVRNYPANLLFATYAGHGVLTRGNFDLALFAWFANPDPDDTQTIASDEIPPRGANDSFYSDPDVDRWVAQGRMHYDRAQRRAYYFKIQQRIHDAVPLHTIIWRANIDAVNTDLRNFKPAPAISDYWNAYEWSI
jgi:peptide/nickel transport system substrate-binding protein